ncbi:MAG: hypothetical protein ACFE94_17815 [Candidatus Hodarchaeota archaeon]
MTQTYKEVVVLKSPKVKKHEVQIHQENEEDKSLGDQNYISNPRYFEEVYNLKTAKQKLYSSNIYGF